MRWASLCRVNDPLLARVRVSSALPTAPAVASPRCAHGDGGGAGRSGTTRASAAPISCGSPIRIMSHEAIPTRPSTRSTRRSSRRPTRGSGENIRPNVDVPRSKLSSSSPSAWPSITSARASRPSAAKRRRISSTIPGASRSREPWPRGALPPLPPRQYRARHPAAEAGMPEPVRTSITSGPRLLVIRSDRRWAVPRRGRAAG